MEHGVWWATPAREGAWCRRMVLPRVRRCRRGRVLGATPMVGIGGALSMVAGLAALYLLRGDVARRAKQGVLSLPEVEGGLATPAVGAAK
jgi:hypothetical protein